jgi:hypothetical protein
MAPSDQVKDSGERAGKDQTSKRDDSAQRDKNEKVGPDGKTDGERASDAYIKQKEQELGTKTNFEAKFGADSGRATEPPKGPSGDPVRQPPSPKIDQLSAPEIHGGDAGGGGGGGGDKMEFPSGGAHQLPNDGGAYPLSLSEAERAAAETRAAGDAMFQKFVKEAELRGEQAASKGGV